ncbi:hypothetical protein A2U01_0061723, partial [Trifolium medium]|nr:hypothetical protein [Trifolium medium]
MWMIRCERKGLLWLKEETLTRRI